MVRVDLNSDLGEGFGLYELGDDAELIRLVSSANIACGFHAGDARVMRQTVALCREHGVAVGAHPGLPDRQGFGRRSMALSPAELRDDVLYQIGALAAFCRAEGVALRHVKPHGALYGMVSTSADLARAVVQAVTQFDPELIMFAPPGSELQRAAEAAGLAVALEGFADRTYQADGQLVPRRLEGAVVHDPDQVVAQAQRIVSEGKVRAITGEEVVMRVHTICVHGDNPAAAELLYRIRQGLQDMGVLIGPPAVATRK